MAVDDIVILVVVSAAVDVAEQLRIDPFASRVVAVVRVEAAVFAVFLFSLCVASMVLLANVHVGRVEAVVVVQVVIVIGVVVVVPVEVSEPGVPVVVSEDGVAISVIPCAVVVPLR